MSKKHRKFSAAVNNIEHFLILGSTIAGCVSIPTFATLVSVPIVYWSQFSNRITNLCNNCSN